MNSLKVLSIAAAMSLALAAAPTTSFAQTKWSGPGGGGVAVGGGGGGGGFRGGGGGGGVAIGGGYRGGYGGHRHHNYGGLGGFGTGLVIGGALGSSYGYYGAPYGYYDDSYYDEGVVAVVPGGGGVEYCRQRYRSYDVRTGTYLGYDGLRHPCP